MSYDELWGNLLAYEEKHINRYSKEEKKTLKAFHATTLEEDENIDKDNYEGTTLINQGVDKSLDKGSRDPKISITRSSQKQTNQCYHRRKEGQIKKNYQKLRRRSSKENKNLGS